MKTLQEYLTSFERNYVYVVKMVSEITESTIDVLERIFAPYEVVAVSPIKCSILQQNPVGFSKDVGASEVWSISITTRRGASSWALKMQLAELLNRHPRTILVQGENDPLNVEARIQDELAAIAAVAKEQNLAPVAELLYQPIQQGQPVPVFGDEYNQKLMNFLAYLQANRPKEVTGHNTVFSWLNKIPAYNSVDWDENVDGLKPVSGSNLDPDKEVEPPVELAPPGNFDDRNRNVSKLFRDAKDNLILLSGKGR